MSCPAVIHIEVIHIDSFMRQRERFFANQKLHKKPQRVRFHMFKDLRPSGLLKEMHHLPPDLRVAEPHIKRDIIP